jgi:predicted lipoprotein with Yx(FWY)xxD motif
MKRSTLILALMLVAAAVAAAGVTAAARPTRVVATAKNAKLGKTILVTTKGLTLYSLSVERKGKFICTNASCLSFWKPLVVRANTTPAGVAHLATVRRPDGRRQVTYKGAPLYTFTGDHSRGDAGGEGFKDVGVWHAAAVGGTSKAASPSPTSGGGGYGGGGSYP